jgi:sugar phosphate isomerase/epimerase
MAAGTIACSSLAYRFLPTADVLDHIVALGFEGVELGVFDGFARLTIAEFLADPADATRQLIAELERTGLDVVGVNTELSEDDAELADAQFAAMLELAVAVGAPVMTLQAARQGTPLEEAAAALAPRVAAAAEVGVALAAETHCFFVTELPVDALRLVDLVPGLGLTLDPGHYWCGPGRGQRFDVLFPHVRHLHIRDSGPTWEEAQVEMGSGLVDFAAVLDGLDRAGYRGAVAVEYIGGEDGSSVESSVVAARDLLEARR